MHEMHKTNPNSKPRWGWQRGSASAASAALLVILLSPIRQNGADDPKDSFPLSYFPMFTKPRGDTTRIIHAVAVLPTGKTVNLPARFAGPGGMNTQRRQMRKAVRQGRAPAVAERVAKRFKRSALSRRLPATRIDIVESQYNIRDYFRGHRAPLIRKLHASTSLTKPVPRSSAQPEVQP